MAVNEHRDFDLYYDRDGHPIDVFRFGELLAQEDYKLVAFDEVGDAEVSTVWLGLDHNWGGGSPLIFETMVFGGVHDLQQWRYSTEVEARAAHEMVLTTLMAEHKQ